MEESEESDCANDRVRLGDLGALLEIVEDGVFRQLRHHVELSAVNTRSNDDDEQMKRTSLSSWLT